MASPPPFSASSVEDVRWFGDRMVLLTGSSQRMEESVWGGQDFGGTGEKTVEMPPPQGKAEDGSLAPSSITAFHAPVPSSLQ